MTDGSLSAPMRLPPFALSLVVGFAMLDPPRHAEGDAPLARIQSALWREDPEVVAEVHDRLSICLSGEPGSGGKPERPLDLPMPKRADAPGEVEAGRLLADTLTAGWVHPHAQAAGNTQSKRPRRKRNQRRGLPVSELAQRAEVPREAMARALEHHGHLEMVPYGGQQKRRLVTKLAESAGYGGNVDPSFSRSVKLDGANRASPFPVFYPERVPELIDSLDFAGIREKVSEMDGKRDKLAWVMEHHPYLPNDFIASLTGYSEPGVRKARRVSTAESTSQVIIGNLPEGRTGRASIITTNLKQTAIANSLEAEREGRPSDVLALNTTNDPETDGEADNSVEAWCASLGSASMDNSHPRRA